MIRSAATFEPKVAEHRAVQGAGHRDPLGPDDRDVDHVSHACARRGFDQVTCLDLVALGAAREVDDDLGSVHRGVDAFAGSQVTSEELDTVLALAALSAEYPDVTARVTQLLHDVPSERAGTAGHQDRCGDGVADLRLHGVSPCHIGRLWGVTSLTPTDARM